MFYVLSHYHRSEEACFVDAFAGGVETKEEARFFMYEEDARAYARLLHIRFNFPEVSHYSVTFIPEGK